MEDTMGKFLDFCSYCLNAIVDIGSILQSFQRTLHKGNLVALFEVNVNERYAGY